MKLPEVEIEVKTVSRPKLTLTCDSTRLKIRPEESEDHVKRIIALADRARLFYTYFGVTLAARGRIDYWEGKYKVHMSTGTRNRENIFSVFEGDRSDDPKKCMLSTIW